jgi:hypothetical protein
LEKIKLPWKKLNCLEKKFNSLGENQIPLEKIKFPLEKLNSLGKN